MISIYVCFWSSSPRSDNTSWKCTNSIDQQGSDVTYSGAPGREPTTPVLPRSRRFPCIVVDVYIVSWHFNQLPPLHQSTHCTGCFFWLVPPRKALSMKLVPPKRKITKYTGPTQDTKYDRVFNNWSNWNRGTFQTNQTNTSNLFQSHNQHQTPPTPTYPKANWQTLLISFAKLFVGYSSSAISFHIFSEQFLQARTNWTIHRRIWQPDVIQ